MPWAIKLDHLQPVKLILFINFRLFHFHAGRPILITLERGRLKMGKWNCPNLNQAQDYECLGHLNLTICSHLQGPISSGRLVRPPNSSEMHAELCSVSLPPRCRRFSVPAALRSRSRRPSGLYGLRSVKVTCLHPVESNNGADMNMGSWEGYFL